MKRIVSAALAAAFLLCAPAFAASEKPVVIKSGHQQVLPAGDTLDLSANPLNSNVTGSTQCLQADSAGVVTGTGSACGTGSGSGTVTTTGSPASGNLAKFSGATAITNGDLSGDCTTSSTLATICLKTNGVSFGTFATQNAATPPAIGGTTPAAGSFSSLTDTAITGFTQCVQANSSGVLSGTGSVCGSAGAGLTLLDSATVSGTSTNTVVLHPSGTSNHLKVIAVGRVLDTSSQFASLRVQFNSDTTAAHYSSSDFWVPTGAGTLAPSINGGWFGSIPTANGGNTIFGNFEGNIYNYRLTSNPITWHVLQAGTSFPRAGQNNDGYWSPPVLAAITSVTLIGEVNNSTSLTSFAAGTTFYLYGY